MSISVTVPVAAHYTRHQMRQRHRPGLQAKVLLIQVGIVLLVVGAVSAAFVAILARVVEREYGERVLNVAHTVALLPALPQAFDSPDPSATLQPLMESVRQADNLSFVVVSNRDRIRYSHPVPEEVGQPLSTDDQPALEGQSYVTVEQGTLGRSIRAKVPIFAADGRVIGVVSVGILEAQVQDLLWSYRPQMAAVGVGALLSGIVVSWLLARHIKRQIFGLEPPEIARLLEQREAMLHGIREGVVAVDRQGTITLVNDAARRLLDLPDGVVGRPVEEVMPESSLRGVVDSGQPQEDQVTLGRNGRAIVINRMPMWRHGQLVGAIATFRDQTEVQRLARELSGARSHLDALRAQAHEFANRLHTISGLLELGWPDRAVSLINATTQAQQALVDDLPRRIGDPEVAALLLGKTSVAVERGVSLEVSPDSHLDPADVYGPDLVTIVGNLIDNAFEATQGQAERRVEVDIQEADGGIGLRVRDTGPGIPADDLDRIFEQGFSTKSGDGRARGVGLALVRRAVARWGGRIDVHNEPGAVFDIWLPRPSASREAAAPGRQLVGMTG